MNQRFGALSFNALGFTLPLSFRRAIMVLGLGAIGFFLAWSGLSDAGTRYSNLLLVIAYWIAPWLAVMFCDMILRASSKEPAEQIERLLFHRAYTNWAGPVAMTTGTGISVLLFSNQVQFVGVVPRHAGSAGDLTFEVGFVLTAVIYLGWRLIAAHGETARAAVAVPGQSLESISD